MTIRISGKGVDIGDALRGRIETGFNAMSPRFLEVDSLQAGSVRANVTVSHEGPAYRTDIQFRLASGAIVRVHSVESNAYRSVDAALDQLTRRLRRYKKLRKNRRIHQRRSPPSPDSELPPIAAQSYVIEAEDKDRGGDDRSDDDDDDEASLIVAEKPALIEALSVPDAVLRLESENATALAFRNPIHGGLNVVYRRADGAIGWIDPDPAEDRARRP